MIVPILVNRVSESGLVNLLLLFQRLLRSAEIWKQSIQNTSRLLRTRCCISTQIWIVCISTNIEIICRRSLCNWNHINLVGVRIFNVCSVSIWFGSIDSSGDVCSQESIIFWHLYSGLSFFLPVYLTCWKIFIAWKTMSITSQLRILIIGGIICNNSISVSLVGLLNLFSDWNFSMVNMVISIHIRSCIDISLEGNGVWDYLNALRLSKFNRLKIIAHTYFLPQVSDWSINIGYWSLRLSPHPWCLKITGGYTHRLSSINISLGDW